MSWLIIEAWASISYCNHVVLCATSSNLSSCIACMCCRMSSSIKHVWACPDLSSRCGHQSLFQSCCCWCYVIQPVRHILHECVVGCPILSSMYEHVPIYLQLHVSSSTVHLHTFLHSLHSNFSPSRPLQLWFEAACETSFARDIYAMQSTPKSRRGRYCFICLFCRRGWDKKHGTCLRNGRGCAAWALIFNCKHVVVSDTSSNLCIMCCMNVL